MSKATLSLCARRGCRREWHDEGPLCEEHFGEVELGRALRGDYGPAERADALDAVVDGYGLGAAAETARLIRTAEREEASS